MNDTYSSRTEPGSAAALGPHATAVVHNRFGRHEFVFETTGLDTVAEVDTAELRHQPSLLLDGRRRIVGFTGRELELATLTGWREAEDPLSIRLVHGPGGQGKSRLAAHFAEASAAAGWAVRQARPVLRASVIARALPGDADLLVVIDYAERWALDDLASVFEDPRFTEKHGTGARTRILLLARTSGLWWSALRDRVRLAAPRSTVTTGEMLLGPIAAEDTERRAVFTAARDRYGDILDCPGAASIAPPEPIGLDAYGSVLTLHMAALVAVDARLRGETAPSDPATLTRYLLGREINHWERMHEKSAQRLSTPPAEMSQAVFVATLSRGLEYGQAVKALRELDIAETGRHAKQIIDDHRSCYPATGDTVLEPLYPDRLGEDFIALRLPGHTEGHVEPDMWTPSALDRLLAEHDGEFPVHAHHTVMILLETAHRWPHVRARVAALFGARPRLAVHAGSAALERLAGLPGIDTTVLEAVARVMPADRSVGLDVGIAAMSEELAARQLATAEPETRVLLRLGLARRLVAAGWLRRALEQVTRAETEARDLVAEDPDLKPLLALCVTFRAGVLLESGRPADALPLIDEARGVFRDLLDQGVPAPALFGSLSQPMTVGQADDHFARQVITGRTTSYHQVYATVLRTRCSVLLSLGRPAEAVTDIREAIVVLESADGHVAEFLRMSSILLALSLSAQGRHDEAATIAEREVAGLRDLVRTDFATQAPVLSEALFVLGLIHMGRGDFDGAETITAEAEELQNRLTDTNPQAHAPLYANILAQLAFQTAVSGRDTQRAKRMCEMAAKLSATFDPRETRLGDDAQAMSWHASAFVLCQEGRWAEALPVAERAAALYHRLAIPTPGIYGPRVASTLMLKAEAERELGRFTEAVGTLQTIIRTMRPLLDTDDEADSVYLDGLHELADVQRQLGRDMAAMATVETAVGRLRVLARRRPETHGPGLAEALFELAYLRLNRVDDRAVASAVEEGLRMLRHGTEPPTGERLDDLYQLLRDIDAETELYDLLPGNLRPPTGRPQPDPDVPRLRGRLVRKRPEPDAN